MTILPPAHKSALMRIAVNGYRMSRAKLSEDTVQALWRAGLVRMDLLTVSLTEDGEDVVMEMLRDSDRGARA